MKPESHSSSEVESLLAQMSLRTPSRELDEKVLEQRDSAPLAMPKETRLKRFGFATLLATAVAAAMGGVLIGSSYPLQSWNRQKASLVASQVDGTGQESGNEVTPVKFNQAAFELLHKHSIDAAYVDCNSCHRDEGVQEAFADWGYGRLDEAQDLVSHDDFKSQKCSDCHEAGPEPAFPKSSQKPRVIKNQQRVVQPIGIHQIYENSRCTDCHVDGPKPLVPRSFRKLKANADKRQARRALRQLRRLGDLMPGNIHWEFRDANCADCHILGSRI